MQSLFDRNFTLNAKNHINQIADSPLWSPDHMAIFSGQGEGPFDSEKSALCYCMRNMYTHYDDYKNVLEIGQYPIPQTPDSIIFMLDIGCGPATAALALSDYLFEKTNHRYTIKYAGIDKSVHMIEIAKRFCAFKDHVGVSSKFKFYTESSSFISAIKLGPPLGIASSVISCSYIFSQNLDQQTIEEFASATHAVASISSDIPLNFVYTNIVSKKKINHLRNFATACKKHRLTVASSYDRTSSKHWRFPNLHDDGFEVKPSRYPDNVGYILSQITQWQPS